MKCFGQPGRKKTIFSDDSHKVDEYFFVTLIKILVNLMDCDFNESDITVR